MSTRKRNWRHLQRQEGAEFLKWAEDNRVLAEQFDVLANALWPMLSGVPDTEVALGIWRSVSKVMARCDDPDTYKSREAACAYAWLHLLDRYVRAWMALKLLLERNCLPMGKNGVNALDVGTGPGPSAFATHDFFASMVRFSEQVERPWWRQKAHLQCVEIESITNSFRHLLAELIYEQSDRRVDSVLAMCSALGDFGEINPRKERDAHFRYLTGYEEYFDEERGWWDSFPLHFPDEANEIAQSFHRYRLLTFGNFLTQDKIVKQNQRVILRLLCEAAPGTVLLVMDGKGKEYSKVYRRVNRLARYSGFRLILEECEVSSSDSSVADRVFEEGKRFYDHLDAIVPNPCEDSETQKIYRHFTKSRGRYSSSQVRAYRKF